MNELSDWESQMSGWKPRGPSARLEHRIFVEGREPEAVAARGVEWLWPLRHAGWTVSAGMAMLVVALGSLHGWGGRFTAGESDLPILTALSNQSWSACFAMAPVTHNGWSASILGWTNDGAFPSTTRSLGQLNTNLLPPKL